VIILSLFWRRTTRNGALAGLIVGAITVIVWAQIEGGLFDMYELVPVFILGALAVVAASLAGPEPSPEILAEFDRVRAEEPERVTTRPARA
jgi:sodium/proline symporter